MIYKILFKRWIPIVPLLFFFQGAVIAQPLTVSKYGVPVMSTEAQHREAVANDSAARMLSLQKAIPGIVLDLRYATRNNFMHRRMYPKNTKQTFLRMPAAAALARVQNTLREKGYGLKIFDAYRPYGVTVSFWELVHDERYVANPNKGSGHNRGLAVDCTILSLATGRELDMGTGFDNFTDTAHHNFTQLPAAVLENRKLLRDLMISNGFQPFETEWWHYAWPNDRNYAVLDFSFDTLTRLSRL